MLTKMDFEKIVACCHFHNWHFHIGEDGDRLFLQIKVNGYCNMSGKPEEWHGRKWFLSPFMTRSEVVRTVFKAVMTAQEHETRERFLYLGHSIFDPRYDVDKLLALRKDSKCLDEREPTSK